MNTFKTAVVLATLLGVGYGIHVVLNKPPTQELTELDDFGLPRIDMDGWQSSPDATVAEGGPHATFNNLQMPDVENPSQYTAGTFATPAAMNVGDASPSRAGTMNPPASSTLEDQAAYSAPAASAPAAEDRQPSLDPGAFPAMPVPAPPANTAGQDHYPPSSVALAAETHSISPSFSQSPPLAGNLSVSGEQDPTAPALNQSAFEQIWQSAQAKLDAERYAEALFTLSLWYSDPNLTNAQRDRLIPLLDELAGNVIYSAESLQDPPHTIQPGETLAQIAANYAVTSEFLARVNGLDRNAVLTPGEQIKIIRGPFRGELNLSRREITVFVGRLYAGRFSVGVGRELPLGELSLEVAEKSGARPYADAQTGNQTPAGDPTNPYGDYWIGLRSPGTPVDPNLGIHSTGERVEASDTRGCITVSERDADDLQAILSIGSLFTIVR